MSGLKKNLFGFKKYLKNAYYRVAECCYASLVVVDYYQYIGRNRLLAFK